MRSSRQHGFTLIEMMVTVAIAGILLAIAVPNMRVFIQNNRLTTAANDLLHSIQVARTEAIKRQNGNVVVCGTADPDASDDTIACSYSSFSGWFVFQDTDGDWTHDVGEPVIERRALVNSTVTVKADNGNIISFAPTGFANPAGAKSPTANLVFCDARGNAIASKNGGVDYSAARAMFVVASGRARISNLKSDVTTVLDGTHLNTTCP